MIPNPNPNPNPNSSPKPNPSQEGDDFALSAADLRKISNVKDQVPSLEPLRAHLQMKRM